MDPASHKRQKLGNEHTSLPGTQSQSDIFVHNRCLRLQFIEQFNELKTGSVTKDLKAINAKRRELIGIIQRLQQAPIQQPYASPLPKLLDATLYSFGQTGSSYSSDNVIDMDADKNNIEYHTQANVGNTGADLTVSIVDSSDKDSVKSFGDENSSSNRNSNYIQEHLLLELPVGHQEIIRLDNRNSSTESQVLVKQVKGIIDSNDVSVENNIKEKGKIGRTIQKYVGSYELSCEIVQNEPQCNDGNHHDKGRPVDELDDLWIGMSVALASSEINQNNQSIVPLERNCEETKDACNHDFLLKDDLGIVCHICGLIQQRIESIFEHSWKKCCQCLLICCSLGIDWQLAFVCYSY